MKEIDLVEVMCWAWVKKRMYIIFFSHVIVTVSYSLSGSSVFAVIVLPAKPSMSYDITSVY